MASSGTQTCNWMCRRCWAWLDICWQNVSKDICEHEPGWGRVSSLLSILSQKSSSRSMPAPEMVEMRWDQSGENQGVHKSAFGEFELGFGFYGRPGCSLIWTQTKIGRSLGISACAVL